MKTKSLLWCTSVFILILAFAVPSLAQEPPLKSGRDGVFIHVSHGGENAHRLLMAMSMAARMAEAKHDVIVYCDIEAVKVLTATAKNVAMEGFPTLRELLDRLVTLHVPVMACPTCMKVAGIQEADVRKGVQVAERSLFFSFTKGRILTLDY